MFEVHVVVSKSRSVAHCAHIQTFTLKLWRSRLVACGAHIQTFAVTNLHTCWTPWSTRDPQPRLIEFTPLWHSGHCAEITLCQHFLRPSKKKKKKNHLVTVWEPGQDTNEHDSRERHDTGQQTRETTEERCDMTHKQFFRSTASPGRHQAQSDATLQVGHRACRCQSRWHVNQVWHSHVLPVVWRLYCSPVHVVHRRCAWRRAPHGNGLTRRFVAGGSTIRRELLLHGGHRALAGVDAGNVPEKDPRL